jgi:LDH2 family malate/lactate/ureidoglycolate dehydrogenase
LAAGSEEVFYPGEIEARNDAHNRADGLLLPADTVADLTKLAHDMELVHKLPFAA